MACRHWVDEGHIACNAWIDGLDNGVHCTRPIGPSWKREQFSIRAAMRAFTSEVGQPHSDQKADRIAGSFCGHIPGELNWRYHAIDDLGGNPMPPGQAVSCPVFGIGRFDATLFIYNLDPWLHWSFPMSTNERRDSYRQ